jgi:cysteine-rich repeat protein
MLDAAVANRTEWSPAVSGNVIIAGTDEVFHSNYGSPGATQLSDSMIAFASDVPAKTGLMVSLSCYYYSAADGTPITVLEQLGSFTVRGLGGLEDIHIVATHPALAGTTDASLSNWGASTHEAFDSFPSSFIPLAIARNVGGPGALSFADGSTGVPYILARGETLSPIFCGNGIVEDTEECDDGNTENGDMCSAQCKIELPTNEAPVCTGAEASPAMLWPPNHKLKNVVIQGITDPDMDPLTLTVTGITQDEPVSSKGSGNTAPADAVINLDGSVSIRAERTGTSPKNGRVYQIDVTATDPSGLSCTSQVKVCVPHDQRDGNECVDDGQNYSSTE